MRIELDALGHPRHYVGVNLAYAEDFKHELVSRCAFPLFQDTPEVNVSRHLHASKDDMLIYDSEGKLAHFVPMRGAASVDLSTPEGYDRVKALLMSTD